jgi:hypothetical protein
MIPRSLKKTKLLTVWIPESLDSCLALGAAKEDSDKSKFVRNAIREKLIRHGVTVKEAR